MKKTEIKLLAAFICMFFLTGCNLFGPSKKDVNQALEAVFRTFENSTTENEPEFRNAYTNAADAIFKNDDESLIHEMSMMVDEGKFFVSGSCTFTDYEDSISQYILSGELAYEFVYPQSNARQGGFGSMVGEFTLASGKVQYIDFSFNQAENGKLSEFLINADGKAVDLSDDSNPYDLFTALSDRLPG
jgi:hypothetical protein